jgi:hypothetical protein
MKEEWSELVRIDMGTQYSILESCKKEVEDNDSENSCSRCHNYLNKLDESLIEISSLRNELAQSIDKYTSLKT